MFAASHVICQKGIMLSSRANFISIFSKMFFWGIAKVCAILLMLLMPMDLMAQEQKDFPLLVEKYRHEIAGVVVSLCSHNYDKERRLLLERKKYTEMDSLVMKQTEAYFFLRSFVASANHYKASIGVASGTYICPGPVMKLTLIDSKGQKKIIKKNVRKMWDYLKNVIIPIEKIEVKSMEVFKIIKVEDISFDKFLAFSNSIERFESEILGNLVLKDITLCNLCVEQYNSDFFPNQEIKEYGYSLLLSDIDVTIWLKD